MSERKYYVYVLLDPRRKGEFKYGKWKFEYEPFYVGKGTGDRALCHFRAYRNNNVTHIKYNALKNSRIETIHKETGREPIICYKRTQLTEAEAYEIEVKLISTLGRMRYGGPLLNLSTGGQVATDVEREPHSEKTKSKISKGIRKTFAEMDPERYAAARRKQGETTRAQNKKRGVEATKEKYSAIAKAQWEGPDSDKHRAVATAKMQAVNAKYAAMSDLDKAKKTAKTRIAYSLYRFQGSDRVKLKLKEILMKFISTSRHRSPVSFKAAFKALCSQHGLCG